MLIQIAYLIGGFVLLIKGADIFVEGASKLAAKLNIPPIVIGLTIIALVLVHLRRQFLLLRQ